MNNLFVLGVITLLIMKVIEENSILSFGVTVTFVSVLMACFFLIIFIITSPYIKFYSVGLRILFFLTNAYDKILFILNKLGCFKKKRPFIWRILVFFRYDVFYKFWSFLRKSKVEGGEFFYKNGFWPNKNIEAYLNLGTRIGLQLTRHINNVSKNIRLNYIKIILLFYKKKNKQSVINNNFEDEVNVDVRLYPTSIIHSYVHSNLYNILFLRKIRIFNKSRYSRNRQYYRTGVYWCLYLNVILMIGLYFWFYKISLVFSYIWFFFFLFIISFFKSRIIQYSLKLFINIGLVMKAAYIFILILENYIFLAKNIIKIITKNGYWDKNKLK